MHIPIEHGRKDHRPDTKTSRAKAGLINALLVACSLSVALAISEGALRIREALLLDESVPPWDIAREFAADNLVRTPAEAFAWRPDGNGLIHTRSRNSTLVYELRPGTRLNEFISINSFGCRDDEFSLEKPEGICRIVLVGDSVSFGWNAAQEFIFASVLEDMLNALTPGERRFEVCNLSVGGYNARQELEVIKTKATRLHPDFLLLQYCSNDDLIGADAGLYRHFNRGPLRTWDFITLHLDILREKLHPGRMLESSYQSVARIAQNNHWPLLVLAMPDNNTSNPAMLALLKRLHLDYLNPEALFDACGKSKIFCDSLHLTSFGHRVVAEELFSYLEEALPCVKAARQDRGAPDFGPVRRAFMAGIDAQDRGNFEEAARHYRESAALDAGYTRLATQQLTLMARGLLSGPAPETALGFARDAVELGSDDVLALQAFGLAAQAHGLYADAVGAFDKSVQLLPGSEVLWRELTLARAQQGDASGANAAFATMRGIMPDRTPEQRHLTFLSLLTFGDTALSCRQPGIALEAYDAAAALAPDNPVARAAQNNTRITIAIQERENAIQAWAARGETALAEKRLDDAAEAYANAAALAPDTATYPYNQGMALMAAGRLSEAVEPFRKLTQLEPEVPDYHACLGLALMACGDSDAWEELDTVDVDNIENSDTAMKLAETYKAAGKIDNAVAAYMQVLRIEPLIFEAAEALYKLKAATANMNDQQVFWAEMSVLLPQSTHVHFFTGIMFLRDHNPGAALNAFTRACELYPENAGAWRFSGEALLLKGQFIQAETAFREALRLNPDLEGACPGLVRALCGQCQIEQARDVWRSCVSNSEP